jgi:hypothetical protein
MSPRPIPGRCRRTKRAARIQGGCQERAVKNISFAQLLDRRLDRRAADETQAGIQDPVARFTPGQFFKEAGTLIAVCLGLGLLTQILMG